MRGDGCGVSAGKVREEQGGLVLMDMGQHGLKDWPEPQPLHQVLVPGLEDRARQMPDLSTLEQITAGASLALTP